MGLHDQGSQMIITACGMRHASLNDHSPLCDAFLLCDAHNCTVDMCTLGEREMELL